MTKTCKHNGSIMQAVFVHTHLASTTAVMAKGGVEPTRGNESLARPQDAATTLAQKFCIDLLI
jgi:hypothetical protein